MTYNLTGEILFTMRIALGVEYDGHGFYGWQRQQHVPTIQEQVESALSKIADEKIEVYCAGRTDRGVHATGQVIHFDTHAIRNLRAWVAGSNTHLPAAIAIRWAQQVDENFHARFSALSRRYRYVIYNHSVRPALMANRVTWYYHSLNIEPMQKAAQYFLGEHDFTSFRSAQCDSHSPMRCVHSMTVSREQDQVIIEIEANAFLHHMVRNIAGVLMHIGSGFEPIEWAEHVLTQKDRRLAAETAPAAGLYLTYVSYPQQYDFQANMSSFS